MIVNHISICPRFSDASIRGKRQVNTYYRMISIHMCLFCWYGIHFLLCVDNGLYTRSTFLWEDGRDCRQSQVERCLKLSI